MSFYTIAATRSFCDELAAFTDRLVSETGMTAPQMRIFLPTRRSIRTLRDAFLRQTGGEPRLLPLMQAIGDADAEELAISMPETDFFPEGLVPPIDPLRRRLVLARLLEKAWQGEYHYAQALDVAADLGRFIDQVHTEELTIDGLSGVIDNHEFADHWKVTLDFLTLLLKDLWPAYLREEGRIDPGLYRRERIRAMSRLFRDKPPQTPVIVAGSTGSIPATRQFIKTVAGLPQGHIVLPALDGDLDDRSWLELHEGHPQYLLKRLLEECRVERKAVRHLGGGASKDRLFVSSEMMRPSQTTEQWQSLTDPLAVKRIRGGIDGIVRCDCENEDEEARVIALAMLEIAADPAQQKTCALITPDRNLAVRVQACLGQWDVQCDDSAGTALSATAIGRFMLSLAHVFGQEQDINPVPFLAALKSPYAGGGRSWPFTMEYRTLVRRLEKDIFRGIRPAGGFDGIIAGLTGNGKSGSADFAAHLAAYMASLSALAEGTHTLSKFVAAHVRVMEDLAARPDMDGAERLWRGEDGEAAAQFLIALQEQDDIAPALTMAGYGALFESLLAGQSVYPRYGTHPRLAILGQIEARMIKADRIILGGLNEGVWPPDTGFDAWMSRPMRASFGLPALERKITLAAHDFTSAFGSQDLVLTRAMRIGGQPAIASRWLQRLDTILTACGLPKQDWPQKTGARYRYWAHYLTGAFAEPVPITRPMPRPPLAVRPTMFSITDIERWVRDPYALYAKRILRLKTLDKVDMDITAADRGTLIHTAMDNFTRAYPGDTLPDGALDRLIAVGRDVFNRQAGHPEIHGLWWPRFVKAAEWYIGFEKKRRYAIAEIFSEAECTWSTTAGDMTFTLHGKADRLEKLKDGQWAVIDYKTGKPPEVRDVAMGIASQLPLEAYILMQGGFAVSAGPAESVTDMQYWTLGGSGEGGEARPAGGKNPEDTAELAQQAGDGVRRLIGAFHDETVPYIGSPDPGCLLRHNDYAHLERIAEWSVVGEDS